VVLSDVAVVDEAAQSESRFDFTTIQPLLWYFLLKGFLHWLKPFVSSFISFSIYKIFQVSAI